MKVIKLLADRVLVYPDEIEDKTPGGILLPDMVKERPRKGKVLMIGPGKVAELTGVRVPIEVQVGDYISYTGYASGGQLEVDGYDRKLVLLNQYEIVAIIE